MNRFDLASLMKTTEEELFRPGGNFDTLFGHDPETVKQARFKKKETILLLLFPVKKTWENKQENPDRKKEHGGSPFV